MLHCETDKAEGGYIKTPGALFIAENGIKVALTTGMTTDRKNFIFTARRGIMAEK